MFWATNRMLAPAKVFDLSRAFVVPEGGVP